jgi:Homeodomain-like domain
MQAVRLKREGWPKPKIAEALGVSYPARRHWLAVAKRDVVEAHHSRPAVGRLPA